MTTLISAIETGVLTKYNILTTQLIKQVCCRKKTTYNINGMIA